MMFHDWTALERLWRVRNVLLVKLTRIAAGTPRTKAGPAETFKEAFSRRDDEATRRRKDQQPVAEQPKQTQSQLLELRQQLGERDAQIAALVAKWEREIGGSGSTRDAFEGGRKSTLRRCADELSALLTSEGTTT